MFVQVGSLSEAELAILMWALIWPLISVNAKMIKEVMPLPEMLPTLPMIAL